MSTRISKDASPVASASAEQARRAAEEAARRAAEEAARRMLEELARLAAQAASLDNQKPDTFKTAQPQTRGPDLATDGTSAPGTSLASENAKDSRVNCLDAVADFLSLAPAVIRARSEVLFLKDSRPGAEGTTGHVVIRQGNNIYDPTTREWTASETWLKQHPEYSVAGSVPGSTVNTILSAPPGPERQAALARANLPPDIANMVVADTGASLPVPTWLEQGGPPPWMQGAWHHLDATTQASVLNGIRAQWSQHVDDMAPAWIRDPSLSPPPMTENWSELTPAQQRATAEQSWNTLVQQEMSLYFEGVPAGGIQATPPLIATEQGWPWGAGSAGEWSKFHVAGQPDIAQYLNVGLIINGEGKDSTHYNLCGELAALSVLGSGLEEGLKAFGAQSTAFASILANDQLLTTANDLVAFLDHQGWLIAGQDEASTGQAGMENLDGVFNAAEPYFNVHARNEPTPEAVERMLAHGGALLVLVNIDGASDGMLKSEATSGEQITHWVNVVDVAEGVNGETYVRVFNPYQNREEVYSWDDFKTAWQSPGDQTGFTYVAAKPPDWTPPPAP